MGAIEIDARHVGTGHPVLIVAEMSCNHHQSLDNALAILGAAKEAGADAVKIQAYDAGSLTLDSDTEPFQMHSGPWAGRTLWELYSEGAMPWAWLPMLKAEADRLGILLFPSVFAIKDILRVAVIDPPAYKVASFELCDTRLISALARQGKPLILSTGMASADEIDDAILAADLGVCRPRYVKATAWPLEPPAQVALLKCTSAYPAPLSEANVQAIPDLPGHHNKKWRRCPVGLSDHSRSNAAVSAAVALGACIVERHFTLDRGAGGPDSAFSDEPAEFAAMVRCIRETEAALGTVHYGPTESEIPMLRYRRSLWAVRDIAAGEVLTPENVRCLRPADGLAPSEYDAVIGKRAKVAIPRATPLTWDLLEC